MITEIKWLGLQNVVNARELGGYVMPDGRRIRNGMLLRGGSLTKASDEDMAKLRDIYNVTRLFDFRTEGEVKRSPDKVPDGAQYLWLPTIDQETEKVGENCLPEEAYIHIDEYVVSHATDSVVKRIAKRLYWDMVSNEYTQLQYSAFLQILVSMPSGAAYWHCSQGKDRTGLGAAFLLCALGADRDLIIEDFDISNVYYRRDVEALRSKILENGGTEDDFEAVDSFVGASKKNFIDTLVSIDRIYGGLKSYVRNILMLSESDEQILRDKFLE